MRRLLFLLPLSLFACSDKGTTDDTGTPDDTADTGESGDTEETGTDSEETDTDPGTATVTGSVIDYEGNPVVGVEMQLCETVCYSAQTDSSGVYSFTEKSGGSYKLDALGHTVDAELGWIRVHVELAPAAAWSAPAALYLPHVYGPESLASGSATFGAGMGSVTLGADLENLTVPFGFEADEFWGGFVAGSEVPAMWDVQNVMAAAAFSPLGTVVKAPIDVSVNAGSAPDGTYNVYSVDAHGEIEGPVGTATASGGVFTATGLQPTILSWLFFVPQK